jgi:hypothetical protein
MKRQKKLELESTHSFDSDTYFAFSLRQRKAIVPYGSLSLDSISLRPEIVVHQQTVLAWGGVHCFEWTKNHGLCF